MVCKAAVKIMAESGAQMMADGSIREEEIMDALKKGDVS